MSPNFVIISWKLSNFLSILGSMIWNIVYWQNVIIGTCINIVLLFHQNGKFQVSLYSCNRAIFVGHSEQRYSSYGFMPHQNNCIEKVGQLLSLKNRCFLTRISELMRAQNGGLEVVICVSHARTKLVKHTIKFPSVNYECTTAGFME